MVILLQGWAGTGVGTALLVEVMCIVGALVVSVKRTRFGVAIDTHPPPPHPYTTHAHPRPL